MLLRRTIRLWARAVKRAGRGEEFCFHVAGKIPPNEVSYGTFCPVKLLCYTTTMNTTPQVTPAPAMNPFIHHRLPLTQPEIAEQFGTTQQYIQRVEMGLTRHAPGPYSEYLEELRGLKPGQLRTEYHAYALAQRALLSPIKEALSETFRNPKISAAEIVRRAAELVRDFFRGDLLSGFHPDYSPHMDLSDANFSEDVADEMLLGQTMKLSTMTFSQWAMNNSPNVPPNILAVLSEIPDWPGSISAAIEANEWPNWPTPQVPQED